MKQFLWLLNLSLKLNGLFKLSISNVLSVLGLSVGVGTLLVALSLVGAYENSYSESVFSVYSHAIITPLNSGMKVSKIKDDIKSSLGHERFFTSSFARQEGLLASKGKVSGINIEGVEPKTVLNVIDLKSKITKGEYILEDKEKNAKVLLGSGLAKRFELNPGDSFAIVIPIKLSNSDKELSRKVFTFKVGGIIDYGSHFVNKRNVVIHKNIVAKMSGANPNFFSAVRLKLKNEGEIESFTNNFRSSFDDEYWVRTWVEAAGGILKVIKFEKIIIFLVTLILAIVASFNVSSNLFLNLVKKTREVSVLMAIGVTKKQIYFMLILNGLFVALSGIFFGTILALFLMALVNYILKSGMFVPPEVYKLTSITLGLSFDVFIMVSLSAIFLCVLASLAPARTIKGFSIIKGLRYG